MNDETIAIVFILFMIGAFILYRKWHKRQKKTYMASDEVIGGFQLRVIEHNPRTNDAQVVLHLSHPTNVLQIESVAVEFIDKKRNFETFELSGFLEEDMFPKLADDKQSALVKFYKSDFLRGIRNNEIKLFRFRFVWQLMDGKKLKTHELAISARYIFFKPDSGFFN